MRTNLLAQATGNTPILTDLRVQEPFAVLPHLNCFLRTLGSTGAATAARFLVRVTDHGQIAAPGRDFKGN